ncbi:MAG TPA: PHB depolymerase family esterase [Acetobacteraceae bacterium]|nr:PHB depolymerase family esterase [Acetobacteraceae bacterium]
MAATPSAPGSATSCVNSYLASLSSPTALSTYLSCLNGSSSTTTSGSGGSSTGSGGSSTGSGGSSTGSGGSSPSLPGHLTTSSYTDSSGTLNYQLYVPSAYQSGTPVPLVVALHGCTQTADVYRQLSRWDNLAEAKGFIVLFPEESSSRNSQSCWNWFQQAHMHRGAGEPAMIAGMVNLVKQRYSIDAKHVDVAGFSAGGAMANVMAATYPDVFAAVGVGSGCEYDGLPCVGYQGPAPSKTGLEAYQAMGSYARVMPAIVFQGDADTIVAPANAPQIVSEWQITDQYAANGGTIPTAPTSTTPGTTSGGRSYTLTTYGDGHGHDLIDYWLVHGMNHAWAGGSGTQQYADPAGPDETSAMYAFFAGHPLP